MLFSLMIVENWRNEVSAKNWETLFIFKQHIKDRKPGASHKIDCFMVERQQNYRHWGTSIRVWYKGFVEITKNYEHPPPPGTIFLYPQPKYYRFRALIMSNDLAYCFYIEPYSSQFFSNTPLLSSDPLPLSCSLLWQ